MNLLEMVKGYMGDETIGRIADTLGIDRGTAKSAVGAVAPTLLAGVAQTANSGEDGARRVASAVDNADESVLSNFGTMLSSGSGTAQSLTQSGTSMLTNLFGGSTTNGIVEAISRYTGLGGGVCGKLIGLVTPLIFGALKRQKTSMGLDAGGLANLLSSQKSSFVSAIPSGLSGMLSSIPGLSALTGAAGAAGTAARGYATSATGAAREAEYRERAYTPAEAEHHEAKPSFGWVIPAALCALLALGLWWWLGGRGEERTARVPQQPAPTVTPAPTPAPQAGEETAQQAAARVGGTVADRASAMSTQVSDVFTSASNTFGQVHDAASAEAAVPKIDAINKQLDTMSQTMKTLPADSRSKLAASISQWRDKLQPVTDKALATPGVGDKLRPSVDAMYKKMDALTAE